jgi:hypothetical protein
MALAGTFPLSLILSLSLVACGGGGGDVVTSTTGSTSNAAVMTVVAPTHAVTIPTSTYPASSVEQGAWTILQQGRILCGFKELTQNANLDTAAANHSRYLNSISIASGKSELTHYEVITTDPYYTGYAPWDRTDFTPLGTDYGTQVAEILEATVWDYDTSNPPIFPTPEQRGANSMRSLMNTVYHLIGAMYHGPDVGLGADIQDVSLGGSSRREEYRFGSLNGFQNSRITLGRRVLATYPCDGSINIPTAFKPDSESPNPFPTLPPDTSIGPPIYLKVDTGQTLTLTSSMVSSGITNVPAVVLTHSNDPQQEIGLNEAFVVPSVALQPNTSYQVTLGGQIDGVAFTRSFTMVTEP